MPKVAMIGAGSTVFATRLISDMLTYPELADSTSITLVDVDQARLATTQAHAERAVEQVGAGMRIEAPATRREALDGADYVIVMVMIGGVAPFEVDIQVPARFGIDQTVGDTLGPGGVFRGLRTIPFLLDLADEMAEVCPDALMLNYANPMAINCWAMNAATDIETIGLCHSVQGTSRQLAQYCNIPADEVTYWVAGINHMAWFLRFEHQGEDAYPADLAGERRPGHRCARPHSLRHVQALRLLRHRVQQPHVGVHPLLPQERRPHHEIHSDKWDYPNFWPVEREPLRKRSGGKWRGRSRWISPAATNMAFRSFTLSRPIRRFA